MEKVLNKDQIIEEELLSVKKKRTQITHRESIDLNDVENRLKKMGYLVKTKPGGSLLVKNLELSESNSITITRKNAYIENVEIQSESLKKIYENMKADVETAMLDSLEISRRKKEVLIKSPRLNDLSVRDIATDMLIKFQNEISSSSYEKWNTAQSIEFNDKNGNKLLSINQIYGTKGEPKIEISYGQEYSGLRKIFDINESELQLLATGNLYKSKTLKEIENFISIGCKKYTRLNDKYDMNVDNNIADSYKVKIGKEIVYDSKYKEPVVYDREWINKLVKIEDRLNEIKHGPIEEMMNDAKTMAKGLKEFTLGIARPYEDGILSGLEMFTGVDEFKNGWDLGHVLYNMEKEYSLYKSKMDSVSDIQAINQKFEIKYYRDNVIENTNIYAKAAVELRYKVDEMLNTISDLKKRAEANMERKCEATKSFFIKNVFDRIANLSKSVVEFSHKLEGSIQNVIKNCAAFMLECGEKYDTFKKTKIEKAFDEIKNRISKEISCFKEKYNDTMKEAKSSLSIEEYCNTKLAQVLNDARVEQSFKGVTSDEFKKIAESKFWDELDNTILKGIAAKSNITTERTPEDVEIIKEAEKAHLQKRQNLYISKVLGKVITEDIMKSSTITTNEAIEKLSKEYHKAAMGFNVHERYTTVKEYKDLSTSEKEMSKDIIKEMIEQMTNINEKLEINDKIRYYTQEVSRSPETPIIDQNR